MNWWNENSKVIIPIVVALGVLYWATLQKAWAEIWSKKEDGTWWKLRCSLIAIGTCLPACVVAIWKQYGGAIIALILKLIKVRLGIPAGLNKLAGKKTEKK